MRAAYNSIHDSDVHDQSAFNLWRLIRVLSAFEWPPRAADFFLPIRSQFDITSIF